MLIKPCDPMTLCEAVETTLEARCGSSGDATAAPEQWRLPRTQPEAAAARAASGVAAGERDLKSLCLWADFLCRRAAVLHNQATDVSAATTAIRTRSRLLAARRPAPHYAS